MKRKNNFLNTLCNVLLVLLIVGLFGGLLNDSLLNESNNENVVKEELKTVKFNFEKNYNNNGLDTFAYNLSEDEYNLFYEVILDDYDKYLNSYFTATINYNGEKMPVQFAANSFINMTAGIHVNSLSYAQGNSFIKFNINDDKTIFLNFVFLGEFDDKNNPSVLTYNTSMNMIPIVESLNLTIIYK